MTVSRWRAVGPGLLFAGAAIGGSHLVQSTRAGAGWGFGLLWAVVLILIWDAWLLLQLVFRAQRPATA